MEVPIVISNEEPYEEIRERVKKFISHLQYCRSSLIPNPKGKFREDIAGPLYLAELECSKYLPACSATPNEVLDAKERAGLL